MKVTDPHIGKPLATSEADDEHIGCSGRHPYLRLRCHTSIAFTFTKIVAVFLVSRFAAAALQTFC